MSTLPSDRFDVIVVGAGPAGVSAAVALGRSGFSVLLCEAGVYPGAENWSGAVYFAENLEHPEVFGREVVEAAPFERRLIERGAFLYNGHSLLGASLRSPEVFRSCYTVLRPVYDRYLAEVAREHGVVLASETTVQSLIRHDGRVIGVHTERGPAYADVVFLAEGDASHLVTQEGYERGDRPEGAPHFLQGIKEVISLPAEVIEERFGVGPGEGVAREYLLRNATRKGRTIRLNMGGFLYTNRDSISLGLVLPLDNLKEHFQGDHNLLMEWYKSLPEIAQLIEGGTLTSYGAKIIRGGGYREIPQLIDDGLAIGGAASGVGIDFPYPNFTGPATAMGQYFAEAVKEIAAGAGSRGEQERPAFTREALERTYLRRVHASHYYRNVEFLKDWPAYVESTKFFFERQLDVANNGAYVLSRPGDGPLKRWWNAVRVLRRAVPTGKIGEVTSETGRLMGIAGFGRLVGAALNPANLGRVLWNTIGAFFPGSAARVGASRPDDPSIAGAGVAEATAHDGSQLRAVYRVLGGGEEPGRMPWLFRWYWRRFGPALASAFSEVYTNDDVVIADKLAAAARHIGGRVSIWDGLVKLVAVVLLGLAGLAQALTEWFQHSVLRWDLNRFRQVPANQLFEANRERIRLDESHVKIGVPYDVKLGTITYQEGHHSHIKVMWPEDLGKRHSITKSPLWNVCPAKVYEVRRNRAGHPGVVVNFDNCIKCETCWRSCDDVDWSRATQQRLIYEVYTPAQGQLHDYLARRPEPQPRLASGQGPAARMRSRAATVADSVDAVAADALATALAMLERSRAALGTYGDELRRSPDVLDEGRRAHLEAVLDGARQPFDAALGAWRDERLAAVRTGCAELDTLWQDAGSRFDEALRQAGAHRYFWADLAARQLVDHHFALITAAMTALAEGCEITVGDLRTDAVLDWERAIEWRAVEARPALFAVDREEIRSEIEERFPSQSLRGLDHGEPLDVEQAEFLHRATAAAAEAGRPNGYGRRDVLLEELAMVDPALAVLVASHLLATDVTRAAVAGPWCTAIVGGRRTAERGADGGWTVSGVADFVPTAMVERFVLVVDGRAFEFDSDAAGVSVEDVGTVGLIGASVRRVVLEGVRVAADRVHEVGDRLDEADLETPSAGEPFAGILGLAAPDLLAIVRGAGEYLLERAREHASGRVQFPGSFEDEAGRDTIAKFGAVKQMLAEMEAHRYLLEAVSMRNAAADADAWTGLATAKILASEAFGPANGSFSYNCGQLFGGTAFSEDDDIAKYYRDSAPFRFLLGHDDAYRVAIGRRRLAAIAQGEALVPADEAERRLIERAGGGLLTDSAARFGQVAERVEEWAAELDGSDEVTAWLAGSAVVRTLAARAALARACRRIEAGVAAESVVEAARLITDRYTAEVPALIEEQELLVETLVAGDDLLARGDLFPGPTIDDADSYAKLIADDRPHGSGEWLVGPFDPDHRRYVPEILANDDRLFGYWTELESEFRQRFVEPRFDGLIYNRYLEKLHMIPDIDLHYLVDRGFMRMPISRELGGEGALKAQYYILCMLMGRYGDAALSLAIMGNTSIGTTPALIGLYQDLPRARAELERVHEHPETLGEIRDGIDGVLGMMQRPDLEAITAAYLQVGELVRRRIGKSMVLKYIGGGFLRAFMGAGAAGRERDLDGFEARLRKARELLDGMLEQIDERLAEYPRRQAAHEQFLRMISAGYTSAFALTEPTAGSDSGGVKTTARIERRRVHRDEDGVLWFWLDEQAEEGRRNLLDAERLEFDFENKKLLYRWSEQVEPAEIDHSEYDYDKDLPDRMRFYMHGDRKVHFTDIAQLREDGAGELFYEFWVLNGAKMWITNGRFAQLFCLYATTEPEGVTGFMVDRHAEGMVVGADEDKLGQRGSPTNELSLNNVRVPHEMLIGFRGRGQVNALETLNTGRAGLAVTTHATVQEMLEDVVPYLSGESDPRFGYGPRERARPLERYWMGRLAEELVGTAGTTYEIVGLLDNKKTASVRMESAIGKYYGSEAEHEVIDWMERVRGLEGQTWLHRIEKTRRDARVLNIYEGTNEVQRFLLLKDLVQRVLPEWRKDAAPVTRTEGLAQAGLVGQLEAAKKRLRGHVEAAVGRFDQLVWANVGAQPVFFRLSEIAGLTKAIDAVLYRLEWCAQHKVPKAYRERLERAGRLYVRRALARIATLERRYERAWSYLVEGRYSPETVLGELSLEQKGAPAEGWGRLSPDLIIAPPLEPLSRDVEIAVLIKPVPASAPRPRVGESGFTEPRITLGANDVAALDAALQLKARDPQRVRVTAYSVAGAMAVPVLREALARGADRAVRLAVERSSDEHDTRFVAEAATAALDRRRPDLVLCGETASDTGQGIMAAYLATRIGVPGFSGVESVAWDDPGAVGVRLGSSSWQKHRLEQQLPCVVAVQADADIRSGFSLQRYLRALTAEIETLQASDLVDQLDALQVRHVPRRSAAAGGDQRRADTPQEAAAVLLGLAGDAGGGADEGVEPYGDRLLGLGEQPQDDSRTALFVVEPIVGGAVPGSLRQELDAARAIARSHRVALDVVVPVDGGDPALVAGAVISIADPRRVYLVAADGLSGYSARGHVEWLEEFWAMYRGRPQWLLASTWANELFARFVAGGIVGVDPGRTWTWTNADTVSNGGGRLRASTSVYGGAASAEALLPSDEGLRVVTLARSAKIEAGEDSYAVPGSADTIVYLWKPQPDYDPADDPIARLRAALGAGGDTLEDAEFIIDFGYGAGGRDGLDDLAEPLRRLLAEELGLPKVMIGATRKVTQDLELLPHDRQIGQTGVTVNPKLIIALAVSGAPQHLDYIGERATILSFNVDPEAPMMKLNEQKARPIVHPIAGDVWKTVPAFIEAVRDHLRKG